MQQIWKYELSTTDDQTIKMPMGAEILTVQMQHRKPCIWALVNTTAKLTERNIEIFGTGNPISVVGERKYIGTYQLLDGGLVFHVFELLSA